MTTNDDAARDDVRADARLRVTRAMLAIVEESGGEVRKVDGRFGPVRRPEPRIGLQVARALEVAAKATLREMVVAAREEGLSWREVGEAFGIKVGGDTEGLPDSKGPAAFDIVTGGGSSDWARTYGRSIHWTCPSCRGSITDRGPELGYPIEMEQGHRDGCSRFAAELQAWEEAAND